MGDFSEKLNILVIDDAYPSRMIISEAFKSDYNVIAAENGRDALNILSTISIDLIFLDLFMPVMDGFEVFRRITEKDEWRSIPVIAVSSSDNVEDQILALDLGAADVMTKPLNIKLAQHRVRNILLKKASANSNSEEGTALLKRIYKNTDIDEKTGIYTRKCFIRKAKELISGNPNKRFVLVRWDIDGFKVLNDVYGFEEGDRILGILGEIFREKAFDNMVYGRWEGDHFVACMDLDDFNRHHIADDVYSLLGDRKFKFELVIRIGVYVIDDPSLEIDLMCDRALLALKTIKGSYNSRVAFYDESMREELIESQQIINEMKSALKEKQFTVYLQPQYNYATGKLHGAEALVRWLHPVKGIIPPGKFVSVFEKNGFITHLDTFVWEEACKLQRKWLDEGTDIVPISVNVSRTDIASLKLVDYFEGLLAKYSLPTWTIRIEITESAYMDNPEQLIKAVESLQKAGFSVEMDDFGSGYSSLNTLKDVPVDMLKLDMKFIEYGANEARGGNILSSVVRMSNWLKLPVLAEGVETKNQADYLKSIGCIYMQGYYFAKPMPVNEFAKLLRANAHDETEKLSIEEDFAKAYEFLTASTQATLLFNSFVGGAAIIEYDGKHLEPIRINDKFFDVIGSTRSEFQQNSEHFFERFDEKYLNRLLHAVSSCVDTKEEVSTVLCGRKMNQELWIRTRLRLLATNVDRYLLYMAIDDISENMNLVNSNVRLTNQLSSVMSSVPGGITDCEVKPDGSIEILFFNERMAHMFGFEYSEYENLFASSPLDAIHPDDAMLLEKRVRLLVDEKLDAVDIRLRHIKKNNKWKWVEFNFAVSRKEKGSSFITGIVIDIDERVNAAQEAELKSHQIMRQKFLVDSLLEDAPFAILEIVRNRDSYHIVNYNSKVWQLIGYESKEAFERAAIHDNDSFGETVQAHATMQKIIAEADAAGNNCHADFNLEFAPKHIEQTSGKAKSFRGNIRKMYYDENETFYRVVFIDRDSDVLLY